MQTEKNVARKKLLVVQYYRRKANTIKLYGNMLTSEIDTQHVKLKFYEVHHFFRVEKNASVHIKQCSYYFSFNGTGSSNKIVE